MPPSAADAPMDLSMKSRRKLRLEEFLRQNLDEAPAGRVIEWVDRAKGVFRILWTHQSSGAFTQDDAALFRYWALARGKPANLSSVELKQSLRMALNKSPSVERIDMPHDEYRYFRFTAWTSREPASLTSSDSSRAFDFPSCKRTSPFDLPSSSPKSRKLEENEETNRQPRQLLRDLLTHPNTSLPDHYTARKSPSPSTSSSSEEEDSPWYRPSEDLTPLHSYEAPASYAFRADTSPYYSHNESDDHLSRRVPSKDDASPKPLALRSDLFQPTPKGDLYPFYLTSLKADPSLWERYRYDSWAKYFARDTCDSPYTVPSLGDGFRPYEQYSFYTSNFPLGPHQIG